MKATINKGGPGIAAPRPVATLPPVAHEPVAASAPQLRGADGGAPEARKALHALALGAEAPPTQSTAAAAAVALGRRLLGRTLGVLDAGRRPLAALGLGVALLGSAAAQQAPVEQLAGASPMPVASAPLSPQAALLQAKLAAPPAIALARAAAKELNSAEVMFTVPSSARLVKHGQSVLVPLDAGRTLHMIELRYQDTRPLKDLEFNRRAPGGTWETFRGAEYRAMETLEKQGKMELKREPDHNSIWVNNPVRVRVDVVDAQGQVVHTIGRKFLDPHVHDAWSPDGPGSAEVDNISNGYEQLPEGKLPAGAQLRLTPTIERKPWEADRVVAMDLSWVKPIYLPDHSARALVREGGWEKPRAEGYAVEPGRPIAAVFVKWTDHGGTSSGGVRLTLPDGSTFTTPPSNVGSGETELIPLDGAVSKDGKLYITGAGIEVGTIEVLYR